MLTGKEGKRRKVYIPTDVSDSLQAMVDDDMNTTSTVNTYLLEEAIQGTVTSFSTEGIVVLPDKSKEKSTLSCAMDKAPRKSVSQYADLVPPTNVTPVGH